MNRKTKTLSTAVDTVVTHYSSLTYFTQKKSIRSIRFKTFGRFFQEVICYEQTCRIVLVWNGFLMDTLEGRNVLFFFFSFFRAYNKIFSVLFDIPCSRKKVDIQKRTVLVLNSNPITFCVCNSDPGAREESHLEAAKLTMSSFWPFCVIYI